MKRRTFIAGLGSAAAWPAVALQSDRIRRVGVLMAFDETDPEAKARFSEFTRRLAELGWTDGRNLRMDVRWAAGNVDRMRTFAKDLVGLQDDVIVAHTTPVTAALKRATQTIPIVFWGVSDPVGERFVAGLPRPGGNLTGFINLEGAMGGKWLQLLLEIAPSTKRVAMIFNPNTAPGGGSYYLPSFEAAAKSLKVDPIAARVSSDTEIETLITSLGRKTDSGLITLPDNFVTSHRQQIISLAARNHVPAVYDQAAFARGGGLLSYGPDRADIFRRSASYVDRILRGEKPAELPVQVPIKFETTINLKTAKSLGLTIPEALLATADEVIQ